MKLTSEELKALYQQRTARSVRKQADCFTEEALAQAVTGKLRRMERERLADHLMTCSDCAREYRLIQSLKPWAEQVAMRSQEPFSEMRITERQESWAALRQFEMACSAAGRFIGG